MFTVKIVNNNDESSSLRSWPSVNVYRKGTEEFDRLIEIEKEKWNHEGLDDDQKQAIIDAIDTHVAVIRTIDFESDYYLCESETAYIMNDAGNTVEVVK